MHGYENELIQDLRRLFDNDCQDCLGGPSCGLASITIAELLEGSALMRADREQATAIIADLKQRLVAAEAERDEAREQLREQSKSFCTHCGKLFPKGKEGLEQFREHISECNSHPLHQMAQRLAAAESRAEPQPGYLQFMQSQLLLKDQLLREVSAAFDSGYTTDNRRWLSLPTDWTDRLR